MSHYLMNNQIRCRVCQILFTSKVFFRGICITTMNQKNTVHSHNKIFFCRIFKNKMLYKPTDKLYMNISLKNKR